MTASEFSLNDDLITRAQAGDESAFSDLARVWSERLYRSACALCREPQLAEDIAQETLFEAWKSIGRFDRRCQFSTWLHGVLRHRYLKAIHRRERFLASVQLATVAAQSAPVVPDPSHRPQQSEEAERIRQAVARLPEGHREVIELRFFAEATLEDIAVALDVPLGTVKSRLHHALEKLRQQQLLVNLNPVSGDSSRWPH